MLRSTFLFSFVVVVSLASLSPNAHAQTPRLVLQDVSSTVDSGARRELASIDGESTAATVLYATGIPLEVLGLGAITFGSIVAFGDASLVGMAFMAAGALGFVVGLVAMSIGIGLDVDSGSRRGALQRRSESQARLVVSPLGIAGTF